MEVWKSKRTSFQIHKFQLLDPNCSNIIELKAKIKLYSHHKEKGIERGILFYIQQKRQQLKLHLQSLSIENAFQTLQLPHNSGPKSRFYFIKPRGCFVLWLFDNVDAKIIY